MSNSKLFITSFSACKLMAKQKVALECLSYHATASRDQTLKLANDVIQPSDTYKLFNFSFIGKSIY
jgi:cGMP-specific 3',5'-cyclic phosphodiesterase